MEIKRATESDPTGVLYAERQIFGEAVIPDAQGEGVGGQVIKEGVSLLPEINSELVFVLGHPDYYTGYGFKPAGALRFAPPIRFG